jgi:hypothetical protein
MKTPRELAEERVTLSAEYARASEQLEEILAVKPAAWQTMRATVASDKAADKLWESTEAGIIEMRLRMKLKRDEKQMSAVKTLLDVFMGEARSQI